MGTFSKNQNSASRNAANFNELRLTIESADTNNTNNPQQQTSDMNQQIQYQQASENSTIQQQHTKEDNNDESVVEFFVNLPVLERATIVTHVSTEPNEKISSS